MVEEPEEFLAPAAVAPVTAGGGEERSSDSGMSNRYRISIEMTFGSIVTHSTSRARTARRTAACTPDAQAHPRAEESPQEEGRGFLGQNHIQSGLSVIDDVAKRKTHMISGVQFANYFIPPPPHHSCSKSTRTSWR
jgi:hypothetical protein